MYRKLRKHHRDYIEDIVHDADISRNHENDDTPEDDAQDSTNNYKQSGDGETDDEDDVSFLNKKDSPTTGTRRSTPSGSNTIPEKYDEEIGVKRMGPQRALDALYRSHKFPNEPDSKEILDRFDAPTRVGYQYGQLIWGWFIAPIDGEYIFYTACDDACDVYMSPDEGKDHIRKIVSQNRWSLHNQWDKYGSDFYTFSYLMKCIRM